jgi:hypothetical protein
MPSITRSNSRAEQKSFLPSRILSIALAIGFAMQSFATVRAFSWDSVGITAKNITGMVRVYPGANPSQVAQQLNALPATDPPLFIIGHWRSGTTLLHELMMLDDRFCCPTTYQCFAPGHFLLTEKMVTSALSWIMPSKRPMDDVSAGWHRPQEDEFALANLGSPSPYRRMAFPVTSPDRPESLDLTTLSPADLDRWRRNMRRFLAVLAVRDPRRPVLKSPPHTARMGVLAEMFPGARFLHVVRDPFVVFPSTMRLWRSLHQSQALQVDPGDTLERYVFAAFDQMYAAFERDRATLPPEHWPELDAVWREAQALADEEDALRFAAASFSCVDLDFSMSANCCCSNANVCPESFGSGIDCNVFCNVSLGVLRLNSPTRSCGMKLHKLSTSILSSRMMSLTAFSVDAVPLTNHLLDLVSASI